MTLVVERERGEVQFGRTSIAFEIRRTERRRTVSIAVDPRDGVLVTTPAGVSQERLTDIVHEKGAWIVEHLRLVARLRPEPSPREFVSGETLRYLGRQYRLRVERGTPGGEVKMERGWLVVSVAHLHEREKSRALREALARWYRAHAQDRLPERVEIWARKFGIQPPTVLIREQRRRWGSCNSAAEVRMNWRVIQAPMALVDYVVAHELDHAVHDQGHTKAFWAHLGRLMPDYEARRDALRALGPHLEW